MAPGRESFILSQDIAPEQIADFHAKLGSNLRKLVDKKVIDTTFFFAIPVSAAATSIRMDANFLDQPIGTGPTELGYLVDRKHEVFQPFTDDAFVAADGREVTTFITTAPSTTFQITLITGSNQGTTVGAPGDVQVGDYVRVVGQGLVSTFFTQVLTKVPAGPNFVLTFSNIFVQGITQNYTAERITRWTVEFRDSSDVPFPMPGGTVELGFFNRVYLADVAETFGMGPINRPELTPEAGGGLSGTSATLELMLDPGETFLWFHGVDDDIPLLTWWVEWLDYPTCRYLYGMQATPSGPYFSHIARTPSLAGTFPVDFQHIDENSTLITNRNSVLHRIKSVVFKPGL